jgi:hypothetical protein
MENAMASETTPSAVKTIGATLSSSTVQPKAKVASRATAKTSARKPATSIVKPRHKSASKKPAATVTIKNPKSASTAKQKKNGKPKKIKMVRDSYTMPENDYAKLTELKKTCLKAGVHVKKSELLRAGLTTLTKLPTATLLKTVEGLVKIKTGRPGKH